MRARSHPARRQQGDRMRRGAFITPLSAVAAATCAPCEGRAQPATTPVVGTLNMQTRATEIERIAALQQGLKETGFIENRNVAFEHRFADGQGERLAALAAELVGRNVNVLVANTTPPASAAKAATATIPIVFVTGV